MLSPASRDPLLAVGPGVSALLLGNEAIARGALEAGIGFASGYPGTPSSEITDALARVAGARDIVFEYAVNEKIALEGAFAATLAGVRALCAMKHLGLASAGDPLATIPYVGPGAGLVVVSAADPSCLTSPNEQDQRWLGPMLHLPILEPDGPAQALEMTRYAFELSEQSRLPILLRPTARVCHARALVPLGALRRPAVPRFDRDPDRLVPIPAVARRLRGQIEERLAIARAALQGRFMRHAGAGRFGLLAAGAAGAVCLDLQETLGLASDVALLALGVAHPLPVLDLLPFLRARERVLVIEDLSPFLEDAVRALCSEHRLPCEILGKRTRHVPLAFEVTPEVAEAAITEAFGLVRASPQRGRAKARPAAPGRDAAEVEVPPRPPLLCAGCPHRAAYVAARIALGEDWLCFNDIGCYTLGHGAPLDTADALLSMGASLSMAATVSRVTGTRTAAFIGDSTFLHSGMPALLDAVKEQASIVAVILDNQVTAMTGLQDSPGIRLTEGGEVGRDVSLETIARALGARDVQTVDPHDLPATVRALERARDGKGVSVVILERPCPMFAARARGEQASPAGIHVIDRNACRTCGREALGFRCDVPTTRGFQRHLYRSRALEHGPVPDRPAIAPCSAACPLFLCVQGYAGHIAAGEPALALAHVLARTVLPETVCRVCHRPCEHACVRAEIDAPIAINDLKRYVIEWAATHDVAPDPSREPDSEWRVAVVGAGPSGLAAAYELRLRGHAVTLYDAAPEPGGLLRSALPSYRLPKEALLRDVNRVLASGVRFVGATALGRDVMLGSLLADYDAVYLAIGAGQRLALGIDGEDGPGAPLVRPALDYLEDVALRKTPVTGRRVVVVGGGNTAVDAARTACRLGAREVTIACIEPRERMPALAEEVLAAEREGVVIRPGLRPRKVLRGRRPALAFTRIEGAGDATAGPARRNGRGPSRIEVDEVLVAVGAAPVLPLGAGDPEVPRDARGLIVVDPVTGETGVPRLFAGGDAVSTDRTVAAAIAWGQRAAWGIDRLLRGEAHADRRPPPPVTIALPPRNGSWPKRADEGVGRKAPGSRAPGHTPGFGEVNGVLGEADARAEAARCMSCGLCGNCRACIDLLGCPPFHLDHGSISLDPALCSDCGVCARLCPDGAVLPHSGAIP